MEFTSPDRPRLMVWDGANNRAAARFRDGVFSSDDPHVIALVSRALGIAEAARCGAAKLDGEPCRGKPVGDTGFCSFHQPKED